MDNRDSLDRSSVDIGRPLPVTDGQGNHSPNADYAGAESNHQSTLNASENEATGAVDAVLQSDVCLNTRPAGVTCN